MHVQNIYEKMKTTVFLNQIIQEARVVLLNLISSKELFIWSRVTRQSGLTNKI